MAKAIVVSLLTVTPCVIAVRERSMDLDSSGAEPKPEDDAKCNWHVAGTHASKVGWLFGGLEHCRCEDESAIIATEKGEVEWSKNFLDDRKNSFDYAKKNLFRDAKCMPRDERVYRQALTDIEKAIANVATSRLVFLDMSIKAQALASFANAFRGESRKTLTRDAYLRGFDCSGRTLRVPELDDACADAMVVFKKYQSEAAYCLEAVHALEHAKEFIDVAAFTTAATLVSQAVKIMREKDNRDDARYTAGEAGAALLGIVQGLLPRVKEVIPPF
jgi:hypothetical protein